MKHPVVLTPDALREYDEAFDRYNAARVGEGRRFALRIERLLAGLSATPTMHAVVVDDVRKAVARPYPYCVYYPVRPGFVEVLSVFHASRDPLDWKDRV